MADLLKKIFAQEQSRPAKKPMPAWIDPMLAKLTHDHFSSEQWIFERKLDGERTVAFIEPNGDVRLMSRNRKPLNDIYPGIEQVLARQAPAGCILDGETVAFNRRGVSDFQKLQPLMQASSREEARASGVKPCYYVFDCLYIDGHDITACSLRSRKNLLRQAVDWSDPLRWTPHRNERGLQYYRQACSRGWEGVIAKHAASAYARGRSSKWLKFKCVMKQEFVIGGFTDPHGERIGLGALLLGFYREADLVYAGQVGTGFDDDTLQDLRSRLNGLERKTSPYAQGAVPSKGVHFVTPRLVCQVAFSEWTIGDRLRHPRYQGLRHDKDPRDVHRETESQTADG